MEYKLEEICEFIRNGASIKQDDNIIGYPITRIETIANSYIDLNRMGYAGIVELGKLEEYLLSDGDILMSHINSEKHLGKTAIYENCKTKIIHGMNLLCLRPRKELVIPKYLNYYFNNVTFRKQLPKITKKSVNQASFSVTDLKNIKISLPKKDTQIKIVEILEKAQELIDKRKEQIEALDELVKSKFIEMFGNLKNEEKVPLEKCTTFIDYRGKTPTLSDNGIRIINAKSVGNGFFKYIEEYISEETYNLWMKRGFPVAGDVLFVTEGHTFGNVCRIPNDLTKFAMGQRVITMQGENGMLNNAFLAQYMQSMAFKIDIDKYKTGSSAQGIRSKELQKILIPIPDIKFQNQFADFVKQVEKLKLEMEQSLKELEDNFNSLMQRAYKGELFN
ncbi:restriction endonuclease subunit S [uncultured Clostridium sp.]|uniref:restriction endonuclease subunit S n=1 Tax=uncultured Clostridium sp. TaxID=59620 RepID=UPI0025DEC210|nr:restriction endonuclease subunit S [uncultured Clostridium sp.]